MKMINEEFISPLPMITCVIHSSIMKEARYSMKNRTFFIEELDPNLIARCKVLYSVQLRNYGPY